jgi:signal transduction histidine kinase
MYFDGEKLQKIVNNLLSNAFKFTPNGGSISLRDGRVVEENRSYFFIEVSDSGVGISEEDQKHIFDRFYR